MATVREIVTRACRKAGIVGPEGDTLTAETISEGVDALNAMVHGWKLRGVDMMWADQVESDTFAMDDEYLEGVVFLLASRISPDYMVPVSFDADDWFRTFQAANTTLPTSTIPTGITNMPSGLRRGGSVY